MALPAAPFSRGASHASCQEMIPGHIRAQPQDPQHSHVTLRASASSYLPGQLVTVTVRSSRDFMGFLLQARGVEGARGGAGAGAGAGVGFRARAGVAAEARSARVGPGLVGGSWTLTPPGSHTLRCLSEGDTLTHSDKQPKRNLSFVWRAPDAPMGDVRFYITVVQSYFVYWAGIESAVVRDGSRRSWSGSNTTGVDGGSLIFPSQEGGVTALPALSAHRASSKQPKETSRPASTVGRPTPKSSGTQGYKSPEKVARPILERNSSATLEYLGDVHEKNSPKTSGTLQNATSGSETDINATSGSVSGPSPAPLRSLYNPPMASSSPVPSKELTLGQNLIIQNHIAPSDPEPNLTTSTQRTVVNPHPKPHPNLDQNSKLNLGNELKPNLPNTDTKPKRPSNPSGTPDKEGKYPDIIPRHRAWELGMLLGSSAGLGMVLVVGVRYMYHQTCGKRTEVTLNDREREYGRGERGLVHVQECGDLVRVQRIRENSFVLLAEYDILASPGD
ncbi:reelin domain-containing protein 1 [Xiphias gladius]|uniref:reelin domain-containing protein 1 n=1 Tax=Xiphias gladius TaxID=8245 RepID=UPI001A98C6C4|nr:reelin domain-containing protein 1 [Xiphias gladius]